MVGAVYFFPKLLMRGMLVLVLLLVFTALPATASKIIGTKHNLSTSGPGTIKATDQDQICIFCHVPHHASGVEPLWSRELSTAVYTPYTSTSLTAQPGQPTGGSRLCLSCHDGTIALGTLKGNHQISTLGPIPFGDPSNLTTDLSDDHPISFAYTSSLAIDGELRDPNDVLLTTSITLENDVNLECTSCHDPHENLYGSFLVMDNTDSALCEGCHTPTGVELDGTPSWASSSHADNGSCESCHASHNAGQSERLLLELSEEGTCLQNCHNGSGAGINISSIISRWSSHPVSDTTGVHDATEDPLLASPHVECVDCHNPHRANNQTASVPAVSGRLEEVKGIDKDGNLIDPAVNEYEVCYRCHAENSFTSALNVQVERMYEELNERWRFDSLNPSFHPVTAIGKNLNVPSLRPEYTESSLIYCTDCHNSDDGKKAGGLGADGPHGSIYPHLLIDSYEQDAYPITYVRSNYELCFRCHDDLLLFNPNISTFGNSHKTHVQNHGVSCSVCHDPHGVPASQGATTLGSAHLINFDTRFVDPLTATYDSVTKSCTVSCHQNNPKSY